MVHDDASDRLVRSPNVLWRRTLRGVLLRPPGGELLLLDGSGWMVWDALASGTSLSQLSERLAAQTGEDAAVIGDDVRGVLEKLARMGAVVAAP